LKRYLLRRALQCLPVLAMVVLASFVLIRMMPGDPAVAALGVGATDVDIENERRRQGLDKPLYVQMTLYVKQLVTLDLPRARDGRRVDAKVREAFATTLRLGLGALVVALVLGLGLGLVSARWPGGPLDWLARVTSVAGVSVPVFWLAMLLVALFAVHLGWLPISGAEPGELRHWVLPCLALGLVYSASLARVTRAALLEELSKPYCTTARAKGLSKWGVLLHHALPNAMIPMVTVIGSQLAGLLTGAVLTETVFSLPGLGQLFYGAIVAKERYLLVTALLFIAVVFVIINFLVDLLYAWLDPRVRYGGAA
jgi:ABC-type dipeptide/oligopeptide/nickel transport system permease component